MKKLALVLVSVFAFGILNSQTISFNPRTGDVEMDGLLKDISKKAKENITGFVNDVSASFNIAKDKVEGLIKVMDPGDVFMTLQTSEIVNKPVEEVKDAYIKNKDKGWGEVAKELGIKPGSKEFHALKDKAKGKKEKGGKGKGNGGSNGKDKENKGKGKKK